MFSTGLRVLLLALGAFAATPALANLVTNGGFEDGFSGWKWNPTSSQSYLNPEARYAHTGSRSAETGCVGHDCVTTEGQGAYFGQTLNTVAGSHYLLSFWVGESYGPSSELSVFWNGALIADILNPANSTLPQAGMVRYAFSDLPATGPATYFEIHGRQDPAWLFIDDVAVVAMPAASLPEPASLSLLALALLGLCLARCR